MGFVGEDQAEPPRLFALEGLAEGQQHLVVQKATPEQHFLCKGGLGQVLGGRKGSGCRENVPAPLLLEGSFNPPPNYLPEVSPDEEACPPVQEGDPQGPELPGDVGVSSLEPGMVLRQVHLVDPICLGEREARSKSPTSLHSVLWVQNAEKKAATSCPDRASPSPSGLIRGDGNIQNGGESP